MTDGAGAIIRVLFTVIKCYVKIQPKTLIKWQSNKVSTAVFFSLLILFVKQKVCTFIWRNTTLKYVKNSHFNSVYWKIKEKFEILHKIGPIYMNHQFMVNISKVMAMKKFRWNVWKVYVNCLFFLFLYVGGHY